MGDFKDHGTAFVDNALIYCERQRLNNFLTLQEDDEFYLKFSSYGLNKSKVKWNRKMVEQILHEIASKGFALFEPYKNQYGDDALKSLFQHGVLSFRPRVSVNNDIENIPDVNTCTIVPVRPLQLYCIQVWDQENPVITGVQPIRLCKEFD